MGTKTIESEDLRLEVCPAAGASIVTFDMALGDAWVPIMRPAPPGAVEGRDTDNMASFNLAPYSNRIRGARFRFRGREFKLRANFPDGTAIHGDVWKRPWKVAEEGSGHLLLTFDSADFADMNFPFPFRVRLRYGLAGGDFEAALELTNAGGEDMPAGFGFHPYFRRTLTDMREEVRLEARVGGVYPGDTPLPTGPPVSVPAFMDFSSLRPLGEPGLDHCFAGWDGSASLFWPGSGVWARLECDPVFSHLVVFTPRGRPFFAVEPVTNCNDGFNLAEEGMEGTGVRVLGPGETLAGRFRISVET